MKGNCVECLSRWYCDINPDECDAWPDPVPMTNADHIRSMTDEELAMHIVNETRACGVCPAFKSCEIKYPNFSACMNVVANWLKQPYGGDT